MTYSEGLIQICEELLGFCPDSWPPSPHQLLGIPSEERDPRAIRAARLAQTKTVRRWASAATGERAHTIQYLLNAINRAAIDQADVGSAAPVLAANPPQTMDALVLPSPTSPPCSEDRKGVSPAPPPKYWFLLSRLLGLLVSAAGRSGLAGMLRFCITLASMAPGALASELLQKIVKASEGLAEAERRTLVLEACTRAALTLESFHAGDVLKSIALCHSTDVEALRNCVGAILNLDGADSIAVLNSLLACIETLEKAKDRSSLLRTCANTAGELRGDFGVYALQLVAEKSAQLRLGWVLRACAKAADRLLARDGCDALGFIARMTDHLERDPVTVEILHICVEARESLINR